MLGMMDQHVASFGGGYLPSVSDNCSFHLSIATTEKFPGSAGCESCQFRNDAL
jgi:hypothetical protein